MRLLAAILLIAGCGDDEVVPVLDEMVTVVAGGFAEADFDMTEGDLVTADFDASGVLLSWDVHSHIGTDLEVYLSGQSVVDTIDFTSPASLRYSFYWQNLTSLDTTLAVAFDVPEGTTFRGWFIE